MLALFARTWPSDTARSSRHRSCVIPTSHLKRSLLSPASPMAPASTRANSSLPKEGYVEDESKGPMLRFQESLPRLPVPKLEDTAARYLKSLHPLLSPAEYENSKAAVDDFIRVGGPGARLQEKLIARREDPKLKNWIYEWWNDSAYLSYRDPVVPYVSYFYSHRDDRLRRDPAKRAAAISTAALSFKKMVDEGTLEPEYMKKLPLCMDSYKWMFNACRVAAKPADYPMKFDPTRNMHIIAMRKNNIYRIPHEIDGQQLTTAELEAQFRRVYELASSRIPSVGALTSENRDVWTDARLALLSACPGNKAALEAVESASFVLCLDDAAPVTLEERAHAYWHGDGQNRWYDKPLQFIVNDNGTSGFMGEHSMMDGTPTHRLNDYVCDVIINNKIEFVESVRSSLPDPIPVRFNVTKEVQVGIDRAIADFKSVVGQHELAVQAYQGYGKRLIKKFGCSPDAYVQMIMQLAYHQMHGKSRPTYESAATRRFQLGRTETCRSVSDASVAWCNAMADYAVDDETKAALFHKAIASHVEYITAASEGKGVDRHLFGLKKLLAPDEELPVIYKDPAYTYSSSWFLSTSQLSSEFFNGYGWSQVIDQGFGIAYMINENSINFNIVSKGIGSNKMSFYLSESAAAVRDLLTAVLEPAKAKL